MVFGYARVSTREQNLDLQLDLLKKYNCDEIYYDIVSGVKASKIELEKLISKLRAGDTIVVYRIDRLGRKTIDLIKFLEDLKESRVFFKSLTDPIDTSSSMGILFFQIISCLAENERNVLSERTRQGLISARARGRMGGRPKGLSKKYIDKADSVKAVYDAKVLTIEEAMKTFEIKSKTTFYKILQYSGADVKKFRKLKNLNKN